MMDNLVDILMPTYNHEQFIEKALQGIVNQKVNFPIRVLIGEDCSTDNTRTIIERFKVEYPEIITPFYRAVNIGANENSKLLFKELRAKYVAMCEGDDYWTDLNKLQKQIDFLESNPDYSICFHKVEVLENNVIVDDYITKVPAEITSQSDLSQTNYIHTVSVVYRNILKEMPDWFSRAMPADYPLWILLTVNNYKIKYFPNVMAVYRIHANGIWSSQDTEKFRQRVAFTMLTCVKYLNLKTPFIQYYILSLANSVKTFGFDYLSHREYLSLATWSLKNAEISVRNKIFILTIGFRKVLNLA